ASAMLPARRRAPPLTLIVPSLLLKPLVPLPPTTMVPPATSALIVPRLTRPALLEAQRIEPLLPRTVTPAPMVKVPAAPVRLESLRRRLAPWPPKTTVAVPARDFA